MLTATRHLLSGAVAMSLLLGAVDGAPADDRIGLLITPDRLEELRNRPNLRILDARAEDQYEAGHVPGAVRVDVNEWKQLALSKGGLSDRDAWSKLVGNLGIGNKTSVVVYAASPTSATRIWWTLKYVGVKNASILDGGFDAWKDAGGLVETVNVQVKPVEFAVSLQPDRIAEIDDVRSILRKGDGVAKIIDTRSLAEHTGTAGGGARKGHIPGAIHQEWSEFVTEEGRFKPVDEIRRLLQAQGLTPDAPAITHCQTGGRASLNAFVMELAGYGPVQNYYCGWSEWSAAEDTPVAKPE